MSEPMSSYSHVPVPPLSNATASSPLPDPPLGGVPYATAQQVWDWLTAQDYARVKAAKISAHFGWAEVFHSRTEAQMALISSKNKRSVLENAVKLAQQLEEVRAKLGGKPITITSWWRDEATNKAIGGASRSQHLLGKAADFNVAELSPKQVQTRLEAWWPGGLGYGHTFTHLDIRPTKARFQYA